MVLSHAVKDFCLIGPRGSGKSLHWFDCTFFLANKSNNFAFLKVNNLATVLGYDVEPVQLYQDMTARDLLQQRTTTEKGDTIWRFLKLL